MLGHIAHCARFWAAGNVQENWAASRLNHWPGQNEEKMQFKFYFISKAILDEFC
jgi:hypothetical protein